MPSSSIMAACPKNATDPIDWDSLARLKASQDLAGCPQNPAFHAEGDVLTHTRLVVQALVALPAWASLPRPEQEILFAAALLHDIGKPATLLALSPDNTSPGSAPGHARKGAFLARRLLWEEDTPYAPREAVVALIRTHMRPRFVAQLPDPQREIYRLSWLTRLDHLSILAEADARGRVAPDISVALDQIAYFKEYATELVCLNSPRAFASSLARLQYFSKPNGDPDYAPYDQSWGTIIMLAGLPGSGKDRWIAKSGLAYPILSLDEYRKKYPRLPSAEIAQMAYNQAKILLAAKTPFIWNATNLIKELRGGAINLCRRYGAKVKVIYLEVPQPVLATQNASRPYTQVVPAAAMDKILDRWDIPDLSEVHELVVLPWKHGRQSSQF